MFAIAVEQQQHETYLLTDESSQAQASVIPERGGIILSWRVGNQDILYLDTERFKDPNLSIRGGVPLLFPICGNLLDDTYTHNGKTYQLKQHGFARNLPWHVSHQSTDAGASVTVSLKSNEETRAGYPFEFELAYVYTLRGNSLELRHQHTNHSSEPMPFSTGIHPYFVVPEKKQLEIDILASHYQVKGEPTLHAFSGFDFDQEEIDFAFVDLSARQASVRDRNRNLQLTICYDSHYSTLVFWTVKGKDFYCLEPWTGPRNALNTGANLLHVEPGATLETVITMSVETL
jgi:galactose mutarotase-like enzyme